jgi:hypothetical protein
MPSPGSTLTAPPSTPHWSEPSPPRLTCTLSRDLSRPWPRTAASVSSGPADRPRADRHRLGATRLRRGEGPFCVARSRRRRLHARGTRRHRTCRGLAAQPPRPLAPRARLRCPVRADDRIDELRVLPGAGPPPARHRGYDRVHRPARRRHRRFPQGARRPVGPPGRRRDCAARPLGRLAPQPRRRGVWADGRWLLGRVHLPQCPGRPRVLGR